MQEVFYRKALEDLNTIHNGDDVFERVCHVLAKTILPDYIFLPPAGGNGRKDGGIDGFDYDKKARMSCSIQKDYSAKINSELGKASNEKEIFYFSNQVIDETQKKKFENINTNNISLKIFSLENLVTGISRIIDPNDLSEIERLLRVSFYTSELYINKFGIEKIQTGDIRLIKKAAVINNNEQIIIDENPLIVFIKQELCKENWSGIKNVFIKGVGGVGKTTILEYFYNFLLHISKEDNLNVKPVPKYFRLKYKPEIKVEKDDVNIKYIYILDGFDEISSEDRLNYRNQIGNVILENKNIKFIISGRDASFTDEVRHLFSGDLVEIKLRPYYDASNHNMRLLKSRYEDSSIKDILFLPFYFSYFENHINDLKLELKNFFKDLILEKLSADKTRFDEALDISKEDNDISKIDINKIVDKLPEFVYNISCGKNYSFSIARLEKIFDRDKVKFLKQSSLFEYQNNEQISFISVLFYEYFIAKYFEDKKLKVIQKYFFLSDNLINVSHLSTLQNLLQLLEKSSDVYKNIVGKLESNGCEYILLIDFYALDDDSRYKRNWKLLVKKLMIATAHQHII